MTETAARLEGGFAEVAAGAWLMGRGQPAAFFGRAVRRRRAGWRVRDRSALDLVETTAAAKCADASRPFLTHIPCAAPVFAVSGKVLVAPAAARKDAHLVKVVPMSAQKIVNAFLIAHTNHVAARYNEFDGPEGILAEFDFGEIIENRRDTD